jgi:hypothetical protein
MKVSVCYLVRFEGRKKSKKSLIDFRRFVSSYKQHEAGASHDLYILVKGTGVEELIETITCEIPPRAHIFWVPDNGYDLGSYTIFAKYIALNYIFILNQHSEIKVNNWLSFYTRVIEETSADAVGSTASFSSLCDPFIIPYREAGLLRFLFLVVKKIAASRFYKKFKSFPNPHVRTNALLVKTQTWLDYFQNKKFESKLECFIAESGKKSFYNYLKSKKQKLYIVRSDNKYTGDIAQWRTFIQFRNDFQTLLIISDNQTRNFDQMSAYRKRIASKETWR